MSDLDGLRSLYYHTAPYYERDIVPVLRPLAADLADWALRCGSARLNYDLFDAFDVAELTLENRQRLCQLNAIDLGTGTGILARELSSHLEHVTGIDLSTDMLHIAQLAAHTAQIANLHFLQADIHHLPIQQKSVHLVVSSFGLNASTPKQSLRTVANILRRGEGMLAFQEWGVEDDCSRITDETLREFSVEDVPGIDLAMQAYFEAPKPWYDQLQDTEDYYDLVKRDIGYDYVWVEESPFYKVHLPTIEPFIAYKMAWASRRFALEAMTDSARQLFVTALHERLQPYLNPDGSFDWSPSLFRVFATR